MKEVVNSFAEKFEITKKLAKEMIDFVTEEISEKIRKEGDFKLPGIGKFSVVERKARKGRNPQTGETVEIAAKKAMKFKAAKELVEKIQ